MAPAVTTVLDQVILLALQRGTRLETRLNLARFQTEPEASTLAAGGPHSGRIPDGRRRQLLSVG